MRLPRKRETTERHKRSAVEFSSSDQNRTSKGGFDASEHNESCENFNPGQSANKIRPSSSCRLGDSVGPVRLGVLAARIVVDLAFQRDAKRVHQLGERTTTEGNDRLPGGNGKRRLMAALNPFEAFADAHTPRPVKTRRKRPAGGKTKSAKDKRLEERGRLAAIGYQTGETKRPMNFQVRKIGVRGRGNFSGAIPNIKKPGKRITLMGR